MEKDPVTGSGLGRTHTKGRGLADLARTALQALAAFCLVAYFALLGHKGFVDIAALATNYPADFWAALGRHLLRNLGGG
jgi:hypothetical protein